MPETQIYYQEGTGDPVYATGYYNGNPVMRENQTFSAYYAGPLTFVNYFNEWGGQRTATGGGEFIDRNVQLLAIPQTIFPKRITSMSNAQPLTNLTNVTNVASINPSGTFQGDKFRWFGTLQQIRIPASDSLKEILGERNWLNGGYHLPNTKSQPANENYKIDDTTQRAAVVMTNMNQRYTSGNQTTSSISVYTGSSSNGQTIIDASADKYTISQSDQVNVPLRSEGFNLDWNQIEWDEGNDRPKQDTRSYPIIKFPMLLSPQFKPWVCFRLITLKFKVSMNEWLQMASDLPYRLNTLFWNKQNNAYIIQGSIYEQWDRATTNSILAKPNPYGGTFKICKNKKIYINPFKGKTLINRIYSKKRSKIVNTKMWQPGQAPIAGLNANDYPQVGYYSNALYISLLLAPLNLDRDFDAFTSNVLSEYFTAKNGSQALLTKTNYMYQWDLDLQNNTEWYQKRLLGANIPGFPAFTAGLQVPYGIALYRQGEILVKTQTKYSEY